MIEMDEKLYKDLLDDTIKQKTTTNSRNWERTERGIQFWWLIPNSPQYRYIFPKKTTEKRREEIWFQILQPYVKYRKAYCESLIVENKRSISHEMVDDTIEDSSEKLSEQVVWDEKYILGII
jgi:hypothetical protein